MKEISDLIKLKYPLVLASQSPRRRKLLEQLGLKFDVAPSTIHEEGLSETEPSKYVSLLASHKAEDVARRCGGRSIVIGADTIVVLEGEIINKPEDVSDAFAMLKKLSGNMHSVYTGISIVDSMTMESISDYMRTRVKFRILTDDEIRAYINTGSPMDKAGAYGIQDDFGAVFVSEINGCYYNIVGLPLELLYTRLKKFLEQM